MHLGEGERAVWIYYLLTERVSNVEDMVVSNPKTSAWIARDGHKDRGVDARKLSESTRHAGAVISALSGAEKGTADYGERFWGKITAPVFRSFHRSSFQRFEQFKLFDPAHSPITSSYA